MMMYWNNANLADVKMNNQENQNNVMQYLSFLLFLMLIIAFATYSSGLDNSDELAIHRQKKMRIFEEMPHMVAPWHIAQSRSGYRGQLSSATFYIKIQDNDFQNFNKTFENHMRQYGFLWGVS